MKLSNIENFPNKERQDNFVCKIEKAIEKYEKIFLFNGHDKYIAALAEAFCKNMLCKNLTKKILIMGNIDYSDMDTINSQKLSETEYNKIYELYSTYEFSDKIQFMTETSQYANLQNYVKTGLLTQSEMYDALLMERT